MSIFDVAADDYKVWHTRQEERRQRSLILGKQGIDAAMHASKQTWYKASKQWGSNAERQPLVDF